MAAAAKGTNQRALSTCQRGGIVISGTVRAIAASIAWQRAQPAAWCSARASASPDNDPSAHAASVSGSTHCGVAAAPGSG
jgi:hypothetical protein